MEMNKIMLAIMRGALKDFSPSDIMGELMGRVSDCFSQGFDENIDEDLNRVQQAIDDYVKELSEQNDVLANLFKLGSSFEIRVHEEKGFGFGIPIWFMEWLSAEERMKNAD